jgi:PAS domain S-box-containing protein
MVMREMTRPQALEPRVTERVLIAAPSDCDADILCRTLHEAGIDTTRCATPDELCREMDSDAGAAVLAEEFLTPDVQRRLIDALSGQPEWSDFPLIVMAPAGELPHRERDLCGELNGNANVVRLQRPVRKFTLVSSVCAALHSRARQYQVRDELLQRRRAELALRQSKERYRRLVAMLPVAVYTCEAPTGVITFYNEQAAELWGRAPEPGDTDERFCGSFRLWLPDGTPLPHDQTPMAVALREGRAFRNLDVVVERPDGSRINVMVNIDPIRDADGRVVGAINAFHDTTELTRTQDALRESEQRYRAVVEGQAEMLCRFRPDGTILFVNGPYARSCGTTPEELIGRSFWDFVPEEDRPGVRALLDQLTPDAPEVCIENHFETPQGPRWTLWTNRALSFDADGRVLEAQSSGIDISDRKQAEAALKAKEAELALVAESTPLILTRCSRDLRYQFANRAAAALFGRTPEEMIGRPIVDIMGEPVFAIVKPFIDKVLRGEPVEYEAELPYTGVGRRWVHVNYIPDRRDDGEVQGWIASIVDVTDRKQAEAALREADRRKDEFLAMLAHELRNPLAPIRTGLEVLKMVRNDPAMQEEIRSTMERQTQQLIALVDDLLDVSRITRGKLELRKCRVDLADIVQSAVEASRPLINEGDQELEVHLPEQPVLIEADPNRLAQVFANLLNNAAKYTPEKGRIRLTVERPKGEVVISVTDTGIGIPAGDLDRIFEMFAQIDRPPEKSYTGLGIGLTLVKSLVEMHGGTVDARSHGTNLGSTFTVKLPILEDLSLEPHKTNPADQTRATDRKRRVLVVDDNKAAADMLSMVVKMLGHEVRTAGDGQQALQIAAEFRPDVVLMDLGMPRMNGYEAAQRMRREPWGRQLMLVALTGWGHDEDKRRSLDCGFDHHLVKPADPAELQVLFSRLEGDQRRHPPAEHVS